MHVFLSARQLQLASENGHHERRTTGTLHPQHKTEPYTHNTKLNPTPTTQNGALHPQHKTEP